MEDKLQIAWQRLIDQCYEHGLRDVLLTVRDGYAEELNSERRARGKMIREAVAKERERCAKVCDERAAYYEVGDDDRPNSRRGAGAKACANAIRAS